MGFIILKIPWHLRIYTSLCLKICGYLTDWHPSKIVVSTLLIIARFIKLESSQAKGSATFSVLTDERNGLAELYPSPEG